MSDGLTRRALKHPSIVARMKYKAPTPNTRWRVDPSLGLIQEKDFIL